MRVHKYHSCENSFLIIDYIFENDYCMLSKKLCSEYDTDGLLVFKNDPMEMLIFNKDGSEANMCGNGIRCMMHYISDKFGIYKYAHIKTKAGIFECEVLNKEPFISVVSLGIGEYKDNIVQNEVFIKNKKINISLFELGVLHAVVLSEEFSLDEENIYELFEHPLLSKNANIDIVKPLNSNVFEIITFEKGVGFTKACGTGAAASGYILHTEFKMDKNLIAVCPGGILKVDIEDQIYLTGESDYIGSYEVLL